jgi:[ribosomal protein S18]-alanine N-acetyltransferase
MTVSPQLLDQIMAVMDAAFDPAFGEAWNRKQVRDALTLSNTHALVVDDKGVAIGDRPLPQAAAGFVLTRHAADEEELLLIAVSPSCRRRGLGSALIKLLIEEARKRGTAYIFLEMRRGNPAMHLYQRLGFEPIGERPEYYRTANGERIDAITFKKAI